MPIYIFQCGKRTCRIKYQFLTNYDPDGKYPGVICPKCNSKRKTQTYMGATPLIQFTDPTGTSKLDNPEWHFGWKMEKAQDERRAAQEASHMGEQPYKTIDDINTGDYFGEVE